MRWAPTGRAPRRHGWWLVLEVGLDLVLVVLLAVMLGVPERLWPGPYDRPEDVALPEVSGDPVAVREYLAGPGQPVVAVVELTADLLAEGTPDDERCRAVAEVELPAVGLPAQVMGAAAGIPDPTTSEMALGQIDALVDLLDSCLAGDADTERVRFSTTIIERRLEELGA